MEILPLRNDLVKRLKRAGLKERFAKQKKLFEENQRHPSLHTEKLRPHQLGLYSFRITRQWRVIFIVIGKDEVEVIDVNPHYNQ
ncbi:type II toxin-antitoxin system YoeB family toxin [Candidatus Shapirobacteria bacterium]|nr:type II toxin-antitoxin system YoeB family toxin [Candidatus Shapirobacteria bacterium]